MVADSDYKVLFVGQPRLGCSASKVGFKAGQETRRGSKASVVCKHGGGSPELAEKCGLHAVYSSAYASDGGNVMGGRKAPEETARGDRRRREWRARSREGGPGKARSRHCTTVHNLWQPLGNGQGRRCSSSWNTTRHAMSCRSTHPTLHFDPILDRLLRTLVKP